MLRHGLLLALLLIGESLDEARSLLPDLLHDDPDRRELALERAAALAAADSDVARWLERRAAASTDLELRGRLAEVLCRASHRVGASLRFRRVTEIGRHEGGADHVAWSPDGLWFAAAGGDRAELRIWDARDWREFVRMEWPRLRLDSLALAEGGRAVVTLASPDRDVDSSRLVAVDASSGAIETDLPLEPGAVVALRPDGREAAVSQGGTTSILLLPAGTPRGEIPGSWASWSPEGDRLAVVQDDEVLLYEPGTLRETGGFLAGATPYPPILFIPGSDELLVADSDHSLTRYSPSTGIARRTPCAAHRPNPAAFLPGGKILANAGSEGVGLIDLESGAPLASWIPGAGYLNSIAVDPRTGMIATAGWRMPVRLWKPAEVPPRRRLPLPPDSNLLRLAPNGDAFATTPEGVLRTAWSGECWLLPGLQTLDGFEISPDGERILVGPDEDALRIHDGRTGRLMGRLPIPADAALSAAFSTDGRDLQLALKDGTIETWSVDSRTLKARTRLAIPEEGIPILDAGHRYVLVADAHRAMETLWDLQSGLPVPLPGGDSGITDSVFAVSPDQRLLVTFREGTLFAHDLPSGALRSVLVRRPSSAVPERRVIRLFFDESGGRLYALAHGPGYGAVIEEFDPVQGRSLSSWIEPGFVEDAAALADGTLLVANDRDVRAGARGKPPTLFRELRAGTSSLSVLDLDREGRVAATRDTDRVRIWDVAGRSRIREFGSERFPVQGGLLMPDGDRLVLSQRGHGAAVRDARSGERLLGLPRGDSSTTFALSPDGDTLAGAGQGSAVFWSLDAGGHPLRIFPLWTGSDALVFPDPARALSAAAGGG